MMADVWIGIFTIFGQIKAIEPLKKWLGLARLGSTWLEFEYIFISSSLNLRNLSKNTRAESKICMCVRIWKITITLTVENCKRNADSQRKRRKKEEEKKTSSCICNEMKKTTTCDYNNSVNIFRFTKPFRNAIEFLMWNNMRCTDEFTVFFLFFENFIWHKPTECYSFIALNNLIWFEWNGPLLRLLL